MEQTEEEKAREAQARAEAIEKFAGPSGKVWSTEELQNEFIVKGFALGICVVQRKSDGVVGTLDFTHTYPRFYFGFQEDKRL